MNRKFLIPSLAILLLAACVSAEAVTPPTITPPLATNTPVPTRTPRPLSTPVATATVAVPAFTGEWLVPAQMVPVSGIERVEWMEGGSLFITYDYFTDTRYAEYGIQGGLLTQFAATPTPRVVQQSYASTSPNSQFVLKCDQVEGLTLLSTAGDLIAKSLIRPYTCDGSDISGIDWTSDDSAVAIIADDGKLYIWEADGSAPREIGGSAAVWTTPSWADDDNRLAVFHTVPEAFDEVTFRVHFRDGRSTIENDSSIYAPDSNKPFWFTSDIIELFLCCSSSFHNVQYRDWQTGRLYIENLSWQYDYDEVSIVSSDRRWMLRSYLYSPVVDGYYSIYDFETRKEFKIADWAEYEMDLLHWSDWDKAFHFLRVPPREGEYDRTVTYGYLRLYPEKRSFVWLARNVVFTQFAGDHFFGVLLDTADSSHSAQLFDQFGNPVSEEFPLSNNRIEFNYFDHSPHAWQWSNSEDRVAYVDAFGDLWLLGIDGQRVQICAGIVDQAEPGWPVEPYLYWSPDDNYLLVVFDGYAWVLDVQ